MKQVKLDFVRNNVNGEADLVSVSRFFLCPILSTFLFNTSINIIPSRAYRYAASPCAICKICVGKTSCSRGLTIESPQL